ncbi:MAG: PEP-CTERM sorting domain-containing protein, partial [Pirellula sp.]
GPAFFQLDNVQLSSVPEPTSMAIFGLGALGLAYRARRKSSV